MKEICLNKQAKTVKINSQKINLIFSHRSSSIINHNSLFQKICLFGAMNIFPFHQRKQKKQTICLFVFSDTEHQNIDWIGIHEKICELLMDTYPIDILVFCVTEHQNIDWIGIHEKICELLVPLKSPITSTCNSEEEREQQKKLKIKRQVYYVRKETRQIFYRF